MIKSKDFLDAFIADIDNQNITLQTYHKSTYTGLLLNFRSFTLFSYKVSAIDKLFKICSNWKSSHNDMQKIKFSLIKIAYLLFLINKIIKMYLFHKHSGLVSSGASLTSWEEGASLALVGHPSSDGVMIKMPYGVDVLHRPASHLALLLNQLRLA